MVDDQREVDEDGLDKLDTMNRRMERIHKRTDLMLGISIAVAFVFGVALITWLVVDGNYGLALLNTLFVLLLVREAYGLYLDRRFRKKRYIRR